MFSSVRTPDKVLYRSKLTLIMLKLRVLEYFRVLLRYVKMQVTDITEQNGLLPLVKHLTIKNCY